MGRQHGIIVFGANGSGKTTLARELARILNFKHMDSEDYHFMDADIPYTAERSYEDCVNLMLADIDKHPSFVISSVTGDYGDKITQMCGLAVFLTAPTEIRIKRVEQREYERHGDRIRPGGDMYEQHLKFVDHAASRSLTPIEQWAEALPCPVIRVDGTVDYRKTAADIAARFYTRPGEPWRVGTARLGELQKYRFTVIFARYNNNWLYTRHKDRDTFETAGGHIEPGETPLECAKRELYEETGATDFFIHPAFDYAVHRDTEFSYGQVFYADIKTLGDIPHDSTMVEVREFNTIPDKLTYPAILPVLYDEMYKWLGLDKSNTEYWDILDENRKPTGRTHRRGDIMQPGDYHLVVFAWIVNSKSELLITRRAFNKIGFPGMWEIPSGSATAGEDSLEAVIREAGEECGLTLRPENAELILSYREYSAFRDNWLFRQDFELSDVVLQDGETIDARTATWDEISAMMERGEFVGREVLTAFDLLRDIL